MDKYIIIKCPHCSRGVIIDKTEINCGIFRHGVWRGSGDPINPHAPKEECEDLVSKGLIYGCGKPFQVNKETFDVSICDYI